MSQQRKICEKKRGYFKAETGNNKGERLKIEYVAEKDGAELDVDFMISLYELAKMFRKRI